ncbi:MAG: universal stress protein [Nitrosopumilaceae archaeon]|nr:universal stress protein [Nitrosopumilaceae archaeon]NIU00857.1 universal stress protein [Nitrosopumilaceae archaeon]NIU87310.1 universal stress protein [Nitrosopumilaceae archaeon]NIV65838.1 universal stress protein [Nitrosopumilaceae archaeon]NIX61459.1 universal stress protein [Nitrosopumilaceae archaeon]
MLFKNILVPYDLSKPSNHAFKVAMDLAKKYGAQITVITCVEGDPWHHKYYDSRADEQLLKKQKKTAKKFLDELMEKAKKEKISIKSTIVKTESIVKELVEYSKSHKIDLIVMGSHGRTGLDKLILGSVANGVIQRSRSPILIVK